MVAVFGSFQLVPRIIRYQHEPQNCEPARLRPPKRITRAPRVESVAARQDHPLEQSSQRKDILFHPYGLFGCSFLTTLVEHPATIEDDQAYGNGDSEELREEAEDVELCGV